MLHSKADAEDAAQLNNEGKGWEAISVQPGQRFGDQSVEWQLIAKNLYSKLRLNFTEHENWTILDYVNHAESQVRNEWAKITFFRI